jgi:hypothetical protein
MVKFSENVCSQVFVLVVRRQAWIGSHPPPYILLSTPVAPLSSGDPVTSFLLFLLVVLSLAIALVEVLRCAPMLLLGV